MNIFDGHSDSTVALYAAGEHGQHRLDGIAELQRRGWSRTKIATMLGITNKQLQTLIGDDHA